MLRDAGWSEQGLDGLQSDWVLGSLAASSEQPLPSSLPPGVHLTCLSCFLFPAPSLSPFLSPVFLFSFLLWNSHQKHRSKITCAAITPPFGSCISPPSPCLCPFSLEALWAGTISPSERLVNHEPLGWSLGTALANMTTDSDNPRNSYFTLLTSENLGR